MTLADFEIELVVRRRNLQNTRPELRIDCFVGNDRNFFPRERTPGVFADQVEVSFVARMKRHRGVGHDRFRPRRGDFQESPRFFHDLIPNEIEIPFLRLAMTSSSETAVCAAGSQLIIRRPR